MRVLEIFGEPVLNGGQESFVVNVMQAMDMEGMTIDLLTPYQCENDYYSSVVEKLGGQIYSFNIPFNPGHSRFGLLSIYSNFLKKHKYDVVHIHSGSISVLMYASLAARKMGVKKIIVHSHCAGDRKTIKYKIIKFFSAPILKKCPTDYFACSKLAGEWKFSKDIVRKKLIVVKNGVDLDKFAYNHGVSASMRLKYGIAENSFAIGHVGRFSVQKNHEYLIRVFQGVVEKIPNSCLLLVGEGELMDDVKQQVDDLSLNDKVVFAGSVSNVQDYLQMMDVFVLPSRWEGLPIVGVEAQAAGIPLLVSENVSNELKLTNGVKFLSLDNIEEWIDEVCKLQGCGRLDNRESLLSHGYDIKKTADFIRKKYFS